MFAQKEFVPGLCKIGEIFHHFATKLALGLRIVEGLIQRLPKDVFDFTRVWYAHPRTPWTITRLLSEVIIINISTAIGKLLSKVTLRADEKEI